MQLPNLKYYQIAALLLLAALFMLLSCKAKEKTSSKEKQVNQLETQEVIKHQQQETKRVNIYRVGSNDYLHLEPVNALVPSFVIKGKDTLKFKNATATIGKQQTKSLEKSTQNKSALSEKNNTKKEQKESTKTNKTKTSKGMQAGFYLVLIFVIALMFILPLVNPFAFITNLIKKRRK